MSFPRNIPLRIRPARCPGPAVGRLGRANRRVQVSEAAAGSTTGNLVRNPMAFEKATQPGTVLVIEGDREIRGLLRFCLEQQGYNVVESATGGEALDAAARCRPTTMLLDLDVPDMDSLTLLHRLREWSHCHMLVLSRQADEELKLRALEAGANDFVVRPFSMAEVSARLRAAQRFAIPAAPEIFRSGNLAVDLASRIVKVSGRAVKLTATEYSLLELFVRNAGRVLTHGQILREIWGAKMLRRLQYLRVYLKLLRDKLEEDPSNPRLLVTEHAVGYRLAIPD